MRLHWPVRSAYADRTGQCNLDRKSTRLNSSPLGISFAVFCLKKKKPPTIAATPAPTATIAAIARGQFDLEIPTAAAARVDAARVPRKAAASQSVRAAPPTTPL